jgi:GT2 family glycosyltransferase
MSCLRGLLQSQVGKRLTRGEGLPLKRPQVRGKFIWLGDEKFYVRGTTYGTFRQGAAGEDYPAPGRVACDFAQMADAGLNAVRVYTVPPKWLLDAAVEHGLLVLIGLPWEQHVTFLGERRLARSIETRARAAARVCAGHPAVLGYAVGNEIPSSIVRWHGPRRVERFLKRLYEAVKEEDPGALVTYVNYPSTEYLRLPFVDLVCFNVFLESAERLDAYLARLQNLAGDRPLLLTELGLDSHSNGLEEQAEALDWQLRIAFASGCAGAFVFSWTDEWHRGGQDVEDWDFGLTDRDRVPKPALATVSRRFATVPLEPGPSVPRISVAVCSRNGAQTLRECLEGVAGLEYPDFEVIVVDDGSTDETANIAEDFDVRLIPQENEGLSNARNRALAAATGEIVAYLDDDAVPDTDWLTYLAEAFAAADHGGMGGPNIPPPDGLISECVANAPGGPMHVLLDDRVAEHVPGCNMAFRTEALKAIGGFDPQFRVAGDDVDVCWRLQGHGFTVGFSPAAMVWHRRRGSIGAYVRQQRGYGSAEALLERKWPAKYNTGGHVIWNGRLYGHGRVQPLSAARWRIYYGSWAQALFQSAEQRPPGYLASLPLLPEWYLVILALAGLSALGLSWGPLYLALPLLAIAVGAVLLQAWVSGAKATFRDPRPGGRASLLALRGVTMLLFLLQPAARLWGRLSYGLTPWRRRGVRSLSVPIPKTRVVWSEYWRAGAEWLRELEVELLRRGVVVRRGGDYDRWDLEIRCGPLAEMRLRLGVEDHEAGRQLLRFRLWPGASAVGLGVPVLLGGLACGPALQDAWVACAVLGAFAVILALAGVIEAARATATLEHGLGALEPRPADERPRLPLAAALAGSHGAYEED